MSPELDAMPEGWDYGPERRPARSLLVGIDPIGLGTPWAESLAGYVTRIAWRHGLAPARLVRDVLAPALGDPGATDADASVWEEELARVTRRPAGSLLGHAPVAATWADALGAATGRPVLRELTLLPWADVLPRKELLRAERAWCPVCVESRRVAGKDAYEPLMWQIAEVTACVLHEVRLRTSCRSCGRTSAILTAWARVGVCRCGAPLGTLSVDASERIQGDELDWQRFVVAQVGQLIAMTPDLEGPVSACRTREAVRLAWRRTGLSLTKLAAAMGVALATVSLWKDGRRQPSLPGALRLCRVSGIALVDFLRGDLDSIPATPAREGELPYVRPSDEHHAAHDWRRIRRRLARASAAPQPRSLASILREVRVGVRQAKRECPAECAAIADHHARWRAEQAELRRAEKVALVRAAIAEVRAEGRYPSRHQVQKLLLTSVSLRDKDLLAIWREEAQEPGWTFAKA